MVRIMLGTIPSLPLIAVNNSFALPEAWSGLSAFKRVIFFCFCLSLLTVQKCRVGEPFKMEDVRMLMDNFPFSMRISSTLDCHQVDNFIGILSDLQRTSTFLRTLASIWFRQYEEGGFK